MRVSVVFSAYAVAALGCVGLFATLVGAAACDENLHPHTTRTDVCTSIIGAGGDGSSLITAFLYALGPALVLVLLLTLLPLARRHFIVTSCAITAAAIAAYVVVLRLAI
jgi:hypothetical protein